MSDFVAKLNELNHWLEKFAPDVLEDLEKPAPTETIAKLNEAYGERVPDDVLLVYAWHDGGQLPDPWWELSGIDEVMHVKKLHESMPDLRLLTNWWSDGWIPICADGDGNHLCVDLDGCFGGTPGQVLVFMHDGAERVVIAPSLAVYMETLLQACRAGVLAYDEEEGFMTDDNQDAWQDFLSAHLKGYPRKMTAGE